MGFGAAALAVGAFGMNVRCQFISVEESSHVLTRSPPRLYLQHNNSPAAVPFVGG